MPVRSNLTQNSWWGKLLGAGLGFLMAGPSGALLGIFIGNFFDRGLNEHFSKPHWSYHTEAQPTVKKTFQRATFLTMGHLCKVDGRVSEEEITFVKKIMWELRLDRAERTAAQQFFTEGKTSHFNLAEPLGLLKNLSQNNKKLLHEYMQLLYRVAQVDGLTTKKINVLNALLRELGLAPLHKQAHTRETFYTHFNQQSRQQQDNQHHSAHTPPPMDNAYALLNIPPNAKKQEVKRAYRKKVSLYHPDKYIAKGRSEKDIKHANEKTQAIRKAYESICEQNGW